MEQTDLDAFAAQPPAPGTVPLLLVVGPTAVGKSTLAVQLARRLGGEIISADSRQLYRGFDVGTAKPTPGEQQGVPHHLIDILPPSRWISVAEYQDLARTAIAAIASRGRLPVLVGGTGFYVRAVVDGLQFPRVAAQPELRARLQAQAEREGPAVLHARLRESDPVTAERLHPNDLFRVIRALEVAEVTGKPLSELQRREQQSPYHLYPLALTAERPELNRRIDRRVDEMMAAGLLAETEALWREHAPGSPLLDTLGYRELVDHLQGGTDMAAAVELIKLHTRQYARRQLTWFRPDKRLCWLDLSKYANMSAAADALAARVGQSLGSGLTGPL